MAQIEESSPEIGFSSGSVASRSTDKKSTATAEIRLIDRDTRGIPLLNNVHVKDNTSFLSISREKVNLKGFVTLLVIMALSENARLLLENMLKYGLLVRFLPLKLINLWITLGMPILLTILAMAYILERHIAPRLSYQRFYYFLLIVQSVLVSMVVFFPPFVTLGKSLNPVLLTVLYLFSLSWACKLTSFHHVIHNIRQTILDKGEEAVEKYTNLKYPYFISFPRLVEYMIMPTLCYQLLYPRTRSIRWAVVIRHFVQTLVCGILIQVILEQHALVTWDNTMQVLKHYHMDKIRGTISICERILKLSTATICVWLLIFLCVFHHWLNLLAEITRFADRKFYEDWWNTKTISEYWRKWNLPVYNFAKRHIHKPLLARGYSTLTAMCVTFAISAFAHEYCVISAIQIRWVGMIFIAMLMQLPLIFLTELPVFRKSEVFGNVFFWIFFCITGQPVLVMIYYMQYKLKYG